MIWIRLAFYILSLINFVTSESRITRTINDCGSRKILSDDDFTTFVVRGKKTHRGQYPWQAQLKFFNKLYFEHLCGGIIISDRWILTAAHCVYNKAPSTLQVWVGRHDLDLPSEAGQQGFEVASLIVHEDYLSSRTKIDNDIALVRIRKQHDKYIEKNDFVQFLCLPPDGIVIDEFTRCEVSGWGKTHKDQFVAKGETPSLILNGGNIPLVSDHYCSSPEVYETRFDVRSMLCAGFVSGENTGACQGDSGGPLACLLPVASEAKQNTDKQCPSGSFVCTGYYRYPRCLASSYVCDGIVHCDDGSDEYPVNPDCTNTTAVRECFTNWDEYTCDNRRCLKNQEGICDGYNDCGDWSDEKDCQYNNTRNCVDRYFKCNDGTCVIQDGRNARCDGYPQCRDKSDEDYCPTTVNECPKEKYYCTVYRRPVCLEDSELCDSRVDCDDGSDELICGLVLPDCEETTCSNGRCIRNSTICDTFNDCGDWSDEENCSSSKHYLKQQCRGSLRNWKCQNGRCVSRYLICDGVDDCGDGSDEDGCSKPRWVAIGIVSAGDGCGDAAKPGLYTRITNFTKWIKKILVL